MTVLSVRHVTTYNYKRPVRFGDHRIMFRPRDSYDQRLISSDLVITPEPRRIRWLHDVFGNCVAIANFSGEATQLLFDSSIVLDHTPLNAPDYSIEDYARSYPFTYGAEEMPDLVRLIERQFLDPDHKVDKWVKRFLRSGRATDTGQLLMTMTYAIKEGFTYTHRHERGTQDPLTTLNTSKGTCRDFAVLMMEAVRSLGLAARFVSGYLHVPSDADEEHVGGGNTHAWCQVYLPGAGWVEFDPTNGIVGNRDLIRVAVARDPRQALPLSGTFYGASEDNLGMKVSVDVREMKTEVALDGSTELTPVVGAAVDAPPRGQMQPA
ncbi:transglutaminase family protein [Lichenifustis flavocetrariae]|uniref:Transglutaminase family protein n=1 Tax=Lichenifustis flavocetrariae TaxID=2949735 RepID=A0AA41YZW0_9HYPH|nr:transglutaminase family protein [Lichenifustis flavocetrariae]MCW6507958.1 transglutaminase family protein [Lichenifustis flavocetrariae]